MNPRFPILSFFSIVLRVLGWLVLAGGLFDSIRHGIALAKCLPYCSVNIPWVLQNVGLLLTGVILIVIGDLIGVAFSIEKNTHIMAEAIEKQSNKQD